MARRKHGEGSTFQRKDGRWVAQVKLEDGKQKQTYHKTEKEAKVALRKMLHELEQGVIVTGPQQTLKAYLEQWLEQVHKPTIRISTYNTYRIMVYKHIIPLLGHIQLQKLSPQQIQAFYARKLEEGLSAKRVRSFHVVLHMAFENAVRWNLMAKNICDLVSPPVPKRYEIQPLTPEQAQHLLEVAHGNRLEALLTLAVATGMRRGELLGLHWEDIDFKTKSLYIRRSLGRVGKYGIVESEPKTARSRRKITLPVFVVEALERHQKLQQEMREEVGKQWKDKGFVFCNAYGENLDPAMLLVYFKQLLVSADLPLIRFHDLRHSAATILLSMGIHPKIVQELLGHSGIGITMDTYSHILPSMQQEAMDKLDSFFKKQG